MIKPSSCKGYKSFKKNYVKNKKQKLLKAGMLSYIHRKKKKYIYKNIYRNPSKKLGIIQERSLTKLPLRSFNTFLNNIYVKENKKAFFNKEFLVFNIV